jgi:predicted alpha/beta superfamily hydrolase
MKKSILQILFLLFIIPAFAQKRMAEDFKSINTGDTYTVTIRYPANFNTTKSYKVVYVPDGSLKMGNYILGTSKSWAAKIPADVVVVTIGHQNGHEMQRQRDFIPSDAGGYSTKEFGQANKFYRFLKNELIPYVKGKIPNQETTGFIGHSFSGLFCLYLLLQPDKLFDKHFAISPSVWANYEEIIKIEKQYSEKNKTLNAHVQIYAGSLEVLNKVLYSATKFYNTVKDRKYKGCTISFETVPWANHISMIQPGVDKALKAL